MQTLLFDLGGVVVDYRGPERLAVLSEGAMSLAEARVALSTSANLHAFERGEIAPEDFAERAVEEWRLAVTPRAFIDDFESWPERLYPGVAEMIAAQKGRFQLACLSNINIPHWRRAKALGLAEMFGRAFLSHEMGARKPEREIFEKTVRALGSSPADVIFFDDVEANVQAAREFGLTAHEVHSDQGLAAAMREARLV